MTTQKQALNQNIDPPTEMLDLIVHKSIYATGQKCPKWF